MKCEVCGCTFKPRKGKANKFCSLPCYHESLKGSKRPDRMIERVTVKCKGCGKEFECRKTRIKKYCTFRCYRDNNLSEEKGRKEKCDFCGKTFIKKYPNQKVCSKKCSINKLSKQPKEKAKLEFVSCGYCCKIFETSYHRPSKYCSHECYQKDLTGKKFPERKTGKYIECDNCGEQFYAKKHRLESFDHLYCSPKCKKEHFGEVLGGVHPTKHASIFSFKVMYNGMFFRSGWEAMFAEFLDTLDVTWEYETFRLKYKDGEKTKTYVSDFYVKETNTLYEIKGFFSDESKRKMKLVKEQYPDITIEILQLKELKNLGVLSHEYLSDSKSYLEKHPQINIIY